MTDNKIYSSSLYAVIILLVAACLSGCTKKYEDINSDPNELTSVDAASLPYVLTAAENKAAWSTSYQTAQNLCADLYAQYFATVTTSFPSDRYTMRLDWFDAAWSAVYTGVVPQLQTLFENYTYNEYPVEYSIANVLWVWAFHRISDYWGPIPYFDAGVVADSVLYDSQESVYKDFFARLDSSIAVFESHTSETSSYGSSDLIYEGSVSKWLKFANTLKLRLAMRISDIEPALAQQYAEEAVASGVMTSSPNDDALLTRTTVDYNGLSAITGWGEFRMSATMASILKGYDDPRLPIYFMPAVNSSEYKGVRNGLTVTQLSISGNTAGDNSNVGERWVSPSYGGLSSYQSTSQNIMCTAEAYFLKAEGALKGWNMGSGTAEALYEDGIRNSMTQWEVTDGVDDYIASTNVPASPGDYLNSDPVSDVPVKFASDRATQLTQIGIQKWLALYPDGCEAWADNRRSRYFVLYPVANSDNTDLPNPSTTNYIRRITFLTTEKNSNLAGVNSGISLLGGEDKITTPLWWDTH